MRNLSAAKEMSPRDNKLKSRLMNRKGRCTPSPSPLPRAGEGNTSDKRYPKRLERLERFERLELLIFDYFSDRSRRPALGRALSPDVNVLRLRAVAAGDDDEYVLGPIGYGNNAVARQL